jgi:hypothetical protein
MSMHQEQATSKSTIESKDHQMWMNQIRQEFMLLVADQEIDFSPCSSWRNSRRIWITEECAGGLGRAPLLERQEGFSRCINLKRVP